MTDPKLINIDQLKEKHNGFLDKCKHLSSKLDADEHFARTKVDAKLRYVFSALGKIGAIDTYVPADDLNGDAMVQVYNLIKNGYYSSVRVFTDGQCVLLAPNNNDLVSIPYGSLPGRAKNKINNVDQEDFDWDEFSNILLEYVHKIIYHSKDAYMMNMFGTTVSG